MENLIQTFKKNKPNIYSSFLITQREDLENEFKKSKDLIEKKIRKAAESNECILQKWQICHRFNNSRN